MLRPPCCDRREETAAPVAVRHSALLTSEHSAVKMAHSDEPSLRSAPNRRYGDIGMAAFGTRGERFVRWSQMVYLAGVVRDRFAFFFTFEVGRRSS